MKNMANKTIYTAQELHIFPQAFKETLSIILLPSIFSLHSSTSLSISLFLHLQFL